MKYWQPVAFLCCILFIRPLMAQTQTRYHFAIPAQPVSDAIVELALQRDLNIVHLSDLTQNMTSKPVIGEFTLNEAFGIMLSNTGLRAKLTNNRLIQITRIPIPQRQKSAIVPFETPPDSATMVKPETLPEEEIEVIGQLVSPYNLGTNTSSTKTQRHFLSSPQIVNVLPDRLIDDTVSRNYAQATLLASSVNYLERSTGVTDELRLRGFAYPALKVNGISSHAYVAPVDVAFIDSIEIAKGPSSALYGRMEPGGVINIQLKDAYSTSNRLKLKHGSDDFNRAEMDLGIPFTNNNNIRFLGYYQQKGRAESLDLDDAQGAMLAIDHQFSEGALLALHFRHESQNVLQQFGRPLGGFDSSVQFFENEDDEVEVIAPLQEDLRSGLDVKRNSVNLSLTDWQLNKWTAALHFQYDNYRSSSVISYPIINEFILEIEDISIDEDDLTAALFDDPEFVELLLEGFESISVDDDSVSFEEETYAYDTHFYSIESTLYREQHLGKIHIEQLYGINVNYSTPKTLIWQSHDTRSTFVPVDQTELLFNAETASSDVEDRNTAAFAQWTLTWDRYTVFAGLRFDHLNFNTNSFNTPYKRRFSESSLRLGGVMAMNKSTSFYASYSQSFSPQFGVRDIPGTKDDEASDEPELAIRFLSPALAEQFEIGVKHLSFDDRLQTSCSLYQIDKREIASAIQSQRSRGLECDLVGSVGQHWHLTMAMSLLDARITQSEEEDWVGNRPRITPKRSFQLWLSRELALAEKWQAQVSAGIRYLDDRFISADNETPLDGYIVADIAATMNIGQQYTLSLYIRNLFDKSYTQGVFNALPYWTNQGAARNLEVRFTYLF